MLQNKYKERMNEEIEKRLNNPSWNFTIASRVIEKKKRKRKHFLLFSIPSFAVSSAFIVLLVIGFFRTSIEYSYDNFITQQVSGVKSVVFNGKYTYALADAHNRTFEDSLFENDIDEDIDNALSLR